MSWHSFIGLNIAAPILQIEGLAICSEVIKHSKTPGHCKIFQRRICIGGFQSPFNWKTGGGNLMGWKCLFLNL